MMNERFTDIESRLTWQEDTLNALNSTVAEQAAKIDLLQQQIIHLKSLIDDLADVQSGGEGHHAPPPHY